jgi:hypothetical protein
MSWPVVVTHLRMINDYYRIPQDSVLSISRGDDFKLIATLSGNTHRDDFLDYRANDKDLQPGEIMYGEEIEGTDDKLISQYIVKNFYPLNKTTGFRDTPNGKYPFSAKVHISHLEQTFMDDKRQVEYVVEFYLCSKISSPFPRRSHRAKVEKVSKTRDDVDARVTAPNITTTDRNGWNEDFALVNTPEFDFIVQYIEGGLLPEWANGIQIEYRRSLKSIPEEQIRIAISEITGFALGSHLNKVGETHFDADHHIVKRVAVSPLGDNVVDKCKSHSQPPVSYDDPRDKIKIERVLNMLGPKYLSVRSAYGLSDILWKYWVAQELAVGINLPIYSSALESLAENYLTSNNLTSKYSQEEKDKHKEFVDQHMVKFFDELSKTTYGNRLVNSIKNPFSIGIGEKLKLFFQTLGFDIQNNSIENEALRARNKMTHGSINSTDVSEKNKYTKLSEAYFTFINRCLLAVLDCKEKYVDYFTVGIPDRDINQNIDIPPKINV